MKIGICTGGGDCPGLNAVIRSVVRYASWQKSWQVYGIRDSFNGLMNRPIEAKLLNPDDVGDLLTRGGTILGTTNHGNPFKDPQAQNKNPKLELLKEAFKDLGLEALIVVGGDGTQTIAHQLWKEGIPIIGIPKTIDNDLPETEETVGFQTAVEVASDAIHRLHSTAESHDRIMILEVMGRDAGYIALHSGMSGGAHIILLPEIPFDYQAITKCIEARKSKGRFHSVVVVAEGAFQKGKSASYIQTETSAHKPQNLGGIGQQVSSELHKRTGIDTRVTVLGHVQRGGSPGPYDRVLATVFGVHAVDAVAMKKFGHFVAKKGNQYLTVPYEGTVGRARPLSLNDPILLAAEKSGICLGR